MLEIIGVVSVASTALSLGIAISGMEGFTKGTTAAADFLVLMFGCYLFGSRDLVCLLLLAEPLNFDMFISRQLTPFFSSTMLH
jgi:hypothetical protein